MKAFIILMSLVVLSLQVQIGDQNDENHNLINYPELIKNAAEDVDSGASKRALSLYASSDMNCLLSGSYGSLAAMGHLALAATGRPDFSLVPKDDAKAEFKHLQAPTSFKASLVQVGNEVHGTLLKAHSSMEYVSMQMTMIPMNMKELVDILENGNADEINEDLKIELDQLAKASKACSSKVSATVAKIDSTLDTLNELDVSITRTQASTEEEKRQTEIKIKSQQAAEELFKKQQKDNEENMKEVQKELKEREEVFDASLKDLGSWNSIGKQFVSNLESTVSGILNTVANDMLKKPSHNPAPQMNNNQNNQNNQNVHSDGNSNREFLQYVDQLFQGSIDPLKVFFKEGKVDFLRLKNDNELKAAKDALELWRPKLEAKISSIPIIAQTDMTNLFEKINQVLSGMEEVGRTEDDVLNLYQVWGNLKTNVDLLKARVDNSNTNNGNTGGSNDAAQQMSAPSQAQLDLKKVELAQNRLESIEKRANDLHEENLRKTQELHKVLQDLSKLRTDEMTQKQIMETIEKAILQLRHLKNSWTQLALFFSNINNLFEAIYSGEMDKFVNRIANERQRAIERGPEYELASRKISKLYKDIQLISVTSNVVLFSTRTYLTLSIEHLMPMMAEFGPLMAIATGDQALVETKRVGLEERQRKAAESLTEIVASERVKFQDGMAENRLQIEGKAKKIGKKDEL